MTSWKFETVIHKVATHLNSGSADQPTSELSVRFICNVCCSFSKLVSSETRSDLAFHQLFVHLTRNGVNAMQNFSGRQHVDDCLSLLCAVSSVVRKRIASGEDKCPKRWMRSNRPKEIKPDRLDMGQQVVLEMPTQQSLILVQSTNEQAVSRFSKSQTPASQSLWDARTAFAQSRSIDILDTEG